MTARTTLLAKLNASRGRYYAFEAGELTTDSSTNAQNATNVNTATSVSGGKVLNCANFVGASSQHLTVPGIGFTQADDFSIFGWCKITSLVGVQAFYSGYFNGLGAGGWVITIDGGTESIIFRVYDTASGSFTDATTYCGSQSGNWVFFCGGFQTSSKKPWVSYNNNTRVFGSAIAGALAAASGAAYICGAAGLPTYTGIADEHGFIGDYLADDEIAYLWNSNAGINPYTDTTPAASTSGGGRIGSRMRPRMRRFRRP